MRSILPIKHGRAIVLCSVMPIRVARMALKSLDYRLLPRLENVINSESVQNAHARVRGPQFGQKWSQTLATQTTMTLRIKSL